MHAELREANQSHHLKQVPDLEVPVVATPLAGLRWSEFARRGRIEQLAIRRLSGEGSPMYLTSRSLLLHEALIRVPKWQSATYDCSRKYDTSSALTPISTRARVYLVDFAGFI
jgi:hypothetical protein